MGIQAGTHLGSYEITSLIGAGGMGEVYKARDTRLDRSVAIKVLPPHLSHSPEVRERFEREARTISSLNHPNICVLHDIGKQDEMDYLVMEYLEGESLAQRLTKGPLPLDQALKCAIEIASALDKAHRQGVTHRDLKPGNIMLTKSGSKLLDFGLAKLTQSSGPVQPLSQMPTAGPSANLTGHGTILGTLQYMSPEQLEGQEADARSDIFAFGAVLYEMLTGRKAFEGKSQSSLIAAIMHVDPPGVSMLQPMISPVLDRVVKNCLAKDPDQRWQTAHDLASELRWITEGGAKSLNAVPETKPVVKNWRRSAGITIGACLLGAAIATVAGWRLKPAPSSTPLPAAHFVLPLPSGQQLADLNYPVVAVSPDGSRLAYVARGSNTPQQIYIRPIDSLEAKPLPGTEGAFHPFFSPDGQWLAFFAGNKLMKVPLRGGAPVTISTPGGNGYYGAAWGPDGNIIFQTMTVGDLLRVSADGGTPQRLNTLDSKKNEISSRWPEFLPGSDTVLLTAGAAGANQAIWRNPQLKLYSLGTGVRRDLPQTGICPRYIPTGHVSYAQAGTLMAVPFDLERLGGTGSPVPIENGVMQSESTGVAQYSFSDNGVLVYVSGGVVGGLRKMVWVDRKGLELPINAPVRDYSRNPRLSPDGRRVAIQIGDEQIWVYDLDRETLTRLTFDGASNNIPAWTPDGKRVSFNSGTPLNLYWQAADGSGKAEKLLTGPNIQAINSWTPDGKAAAFVEINPATATDIWTFQLRDRTAQPFIKTPFNEGAPAFSPDGHWLAYSSDESGRIEIYVQPYPGPGGKWQVSTDGGTEPVWNRNGREMFYRNGNKLMAVDVTLTPSFSAGRPRMLFEGPYLPTPGTFPNYDISPDGQRFLMLKSSEQESAPAQIHVVVNWFDELKRKAPVK